MKNLKRTFSIVLILLLLFGMLPMDIYAVNTAVPTITSGAWQGNNTIKLNWDTPISNSDILFTNDYSQQYLDCQANWNGTYANGSFLNVGISGNGWQYTKTGGFNSYDSPRRAAVKIIDGIGVNRTRGLRAGTSVPDGGWAYNAYFKSDGSFWYSNVPEGVNINSSEWYWTPRPGQSYGDWVQIKPEKPIIMRIQAKGQGNFWTGLDGNFSGNTVVYNGLSWGENLTVAQLKNKINNGIPLEINGLGIGPYEMWITTNLCSDYTNNYIFMTGIVENGKYKVTWVSNEWGAVRPGQVVKTPAQRDLTWKDVKIGDPLYTPEHVGQWRAQINPNSSDWQWYSANTGIPKTQTIMDLGGWFMPWSGVNSTSEMFIDNMTFAYAPLSRVYRDGVLIMNSDYTVELSDTGAVDKAVPNTPIISQTTNASTTTINWGAVADNGTPYRYTATSVDNYGVESVQSAPLTVNALSGINRYEIYSNGVLAGTSTGTSFIMPKNIGAQNVYVLAVDNSGNKSAASNILSDTTAPTLNLSQEISSYTNQNVTITASGADVGFGFKDIQKPDGTIVESPSTTYTVSTNGTYTFTARDMSLNNISQSMTIGNIDKTLPIVTGHTLKEIASRSTITNKSVLVTVSASDNLSGIKTLKYQLPGESWVDFSGNFTVNKDVSGTINIKAVDNAGNESVVYPINDLIIEHTSPSLSLTPSVKEGVWSKDDIDVIISSSDTNGLKSITWTTNAPVSQSGSITPVTGESKITLTSEGNYDLTVISTDNAGNTTTKTTKIMIDKTKPLLTVSNPDGWSNIDEVLNILSSDSLSGVKSLTFTTNESTPQTGTVSSNFIKLINEGSYKVIVTLTDNAGNIVTQERDIKIDKTVPIINSHTLTELPQYARTITNKQVKVGLSIADSLSDFDYIEYKLPSESSFKKLTQGTKEFIVDKPNEGNITVIAYDKAQNASIPYNVTDLTIDNESPILSISASPNTWTNTDVDVNLSVSDVNGISNISYTTTEVVPQTGNITGKDNFTLTNDGSYVVSVTATDTAGNITTKETEIKIDKTLPIINSYDIVLTETPALSRGNTITNKQVNINLDITDDLSGFDYFEYKLNGQDKYTRMPNGKKSFSVLSVYSGKISVVAYDISGNSSKTLEINDLIIENTAPKISMPSNIYWINDSVNILVDISDDNGIYSASWFANSNPEQAGELSEGSSNINLTEEGAYVLTVTAIDTANNLSQEMATIMIDKTMPEIQSHSISKISRNLGLNVNGYNEPILVQFIPYDSLSGINKSQYSLDSINWLDTSGNSFVLDSEYDGDVFIKTLDIAGNESEIYTIEDVLIDFTPPVLTVGDTTGWHKNDLSVAVFADETYLKDISYFTDEDSPQSGIISNDSTITLTNEGEYQLTVTAIDTSGNEVSEVRDIKIDKTAPIIDVELSEVELRARIATNKAIKVDVTVNEMGSGFNYLEYKFDNTDWLRLADGETSFAYSDIYNGSLEIRAYDIAGNVSQIFKNDEVIIDRTNPILIVEGSEEWSREPIVFSVTIGDDSSGIEEILCTYPINGEFITSEVTDGTFTISEDGIYEITFTAIDNAGNETQISRNVKIDKTLELDAPNIELGDAVSDVWTNQSIEIKAFMPQDKIPVSGILKYQHAIVGDELVWIDGLPDGNIEQNKTYVIRAVTNAGLEGNSSNPFIVKLDKTLPEIKNVSIKDDSYFNNSPEITFDVYENDSGEYKSEYSLDGTTWISIENHKFSLSEEFVGNIQIRVIDIAGNVSKIYEVKGVNIDFNKPYLTFENYENGIITLKSNESLTKTDNGYIVLENPKDKSKMSDIHISNNRIYVQDSMVFINVLGLFDLNKDFELVVPNGMFRDTSKNDSVEFRHLIDVPEDNIFVNVLGYTGKIEKNEEEFKALLNKEFNSYDMIIPLNSTGILKITPHFTSSKDVTYKVYDKDNNLISEQNSFDVSSGNSFKFVSIIEEKEFVLNILKANYEIDTVGDIKIDKGEVMGALDVKKDLASPSISDIKLVISVENIGEDILDSETKKIEESGKVQKNETLAKPIDVYVMKYTGWNGEYNEGEKVVNLQNPIKIGLPIPESLNNRQYYKVARIHEGQVEILDAVKENNMITFSSDRFSTYSIIAGPTIPHGGNDGGGNGGGGNISIEIKPTPDYLSTVPITKNKLIAPLSVFVNNVCKFIPNSDDKYTLQVNKVVFSDVSSKDWYYAPITFLAAREVFKGFPDGSFAPHKQTTRGEFITTLMRLNGPTMNTVKNHFEDVKPDSWNAKYINQAYELGIVDGLGNGLFAPNKNITRQEIAKILYNYLNIKFGISSNGNLDRFIDKSEVSSWAYEGFEQLEGLGIIAGNKNKELNPKDNATRAEIAQMLYKTIEKIVLTQETKEIKA